MSKRTALNVEGATSPVNLRTRSTGTVHAADAEGGPLCSTRVTAAAMEATSAPVSCLSCLKLQPVEAVERQELPAVTPPAAPEFSVERCPAWCVADHSNGIDAEHESELVTVAAPEGADDAEVVAQLMQEPGEPLRLSLGVCKGVECLGDADLTIDDAERLVEHLQTLITTARPDSPHITDPEKRIK